jgi:hypothetical protein
LGMEDLIQTHERQDEQNSFHIWIMLF